MFSFKGINPATRNFYSYSKDNVVYENEAELYKLKKNKLQAHFLYIVIRELWICVFSDPIFLIIFEYWVFW